jgi:hypothetical protein
MTDERDSRDRPWLHDFDAATLRKLQKDLPPTQLWSLLLDVLEQRAVERTPARLMQQWEHDRFVTPSYIDQRTQLALDGHLFEAAKQFDAIELSPVAPLAVASAVALTSQNRVVSTARGTEVVSDPTNVLALECARRLRVGGVGTIRLATSHRCVRAQQVPNIPGFAAHFRMFCLTTAGHETKDQAFTVESFVEHVRTHWSALDLLERHGYRFEDRAVTLLATPERSPLADRITAVLSPIEVRREPLTRAYYDGLRFMISARSKSGDDIPLIDGGTFDWVAKLASNRKLVFVASAIGSQLAAYAFRL